jgi:hypothetical protein
MNSIWCFGDSFTAGHGCTPEFEYCQNYKKDKDNLWCNHLGNLLNMNVINNGKNGCSNDIIFDLILENFNNIKPNDIVIIGKTFSYRYDIPSLNIKNEWVSAHDVIYHKEKYNEEQYQTILNFSYHFAKDKKYKNRQNNRINFLISLLNEKNIKTLLWSVEEDILFYDRIRDATNGKIDDAHLSFKGHLQFYQWIYQKLIKIL